MAASAKSQNRATDDDTSQLKQKHKNLTDRLVFYPSSNNIADYNSSMNLNYMGYGGKEGQEPQQSTPARQQYYVRQASPNEQRKQQLQQQHQQLQQQHELLRQDDMSDVRTYMRSTSVPARSMYYNEYGEPCDASNRYISNQSGYVSISSQSGQHYVQVPFPSGQQQAHDKRDAELAANHKYLNKFSQWIPDQLKLKRMSKRYRSHSLPAVADSDDDTMLQQQSKGSGRGMQPQPSSSSHQDKRMYGKPQKDLSAKSMFTSPIKSGRSFLQRKSLSLSTPLARDENNSSKKKKRSIASTMSNIMQKAKVYRRHSFSHSQLVNDYGPKTVDGQRQMNQPQSMQGPSSKFMITKQPPQSYSQSDPESVYSDFFSDNEDRSASDTGDRFGDKDLSNVVNLFATMDQSAVHQRQEQQAKEAEQGDSLINIIHIRIFNLQLTSGEILQWNSECNCTFLVCSFPNSKRKFSFASLVNWKI